MMMDRQATYSGTREVAPALKFDVSRLEAYLASDPLPHNPRLSWLARMLRPVERGAGVRPCPGVL